ncbi:MAG: heme lyase CcmF/NrfE family subunit [Actinobacteria bacterium]|nr:heme lyase CcmF/NrfE family subunit [Actinomycetota bacterium]
MSGLGTIALFIGFAAAVWAFGAGFYGARSGNTAAIRSAEGGILGATLALTVAAAALWYALISHDFSIEYVASYSSRELSLFYLIGSFWAGQAGSILLWAWMLSIYAAVIVKQNRFRHRDLMPYVSTTLAAVLMLFTFLMVFAGTNPFQTGEFTPPNGSGLNPLLQNYSQMFHPVTIYIGFVGFTVPFAFCIAALATGRLDDRWLRAVRGWTIWAWLFLGTGIVLGGRWAYVELGWGGCWGWDPVENASLIPWLIGTAFLHSVMIQEKKGMLKVWNVTLAVSAFALSLYGTFLTRSGVVQSVHAFAESNVGPYLMLGIALVVGISGMLIIYRLPDLRSKAVMESIFSREGSFLLNNLLFVALAFLVFWGTTYPIIAQAVSREVSVRAPFFNFFAGPLGAALILLTGFCPLLAWRKASKKNLKRNFIAPAIGGALVTLLMLVAGGGQHWGTALIGGFSTFVFVTISSEFYRGIRARRRIKHENSITATGKLFTTNPRRYAGYLIHLGMIILLFGVAINFSYKSDARASLQAGESTMVKGYRISVAEIKEEDSVTEDGGLLKSAIIANVKVEDADGKTLGIIHTEKARYQNQDQDTTEVGILPSLNEDLYIILESADPSTGSASLRFIVNPAMFWVWIGCVLTIAGGVMTALYGRNKEEVTRETARAFAASEL